MIFNTADKHFDSLSPNSRLIRLLKILNKRANIYFGDLKEKESDSLNTFKEWYLIRSFISLSCKSLQIYLYELLREKSSQNQEASCEKKVFFCYLSFAMLGKHISLQS